MTNEQYTQLNRIYNTLGMISTKGEDTLVMADCLRALSALIQEINVSGSEEKGA